MYPSSRITEEYPITYDATRAPVPFGRWAPGLLTRWLTSNQLHERQRTLYTLCDYLHDPEHITVCLLTDVVGVLCRCLDDDDSIVRHKAAECLEIIARHAVGRDDLIQRDALTYLSWKFTDPVPLVRRNVHRAIAGLMRSSEGVEVGLASDLIPQLLDRILTEHPEITLLILKSLQPLLREDPDHGLILGGICTMNQLLEHEVSSIRAGAAACLHYLTVPTQGKNEAVILGSIPILVSLLKDWDAEVRTEAAAALSTILTTTPAKEQAVVLPTLENLLALAKDVDFVLQRMMAFQALGVLCAHPQARQQLRKEKALFEEGKNSSDPGVSDCAARALDSINWDP